MIEKPTLEAWRWGDPADVAERDELQANAAAARESAQLYERLAKRALQQRIRDKVFKKRGQA